MAIDRIFVDKWAGLVLANDRDPAFRAVSRIRAMAAGRAGLWVTTDSVLDETITRLFAARPFSEFGITASRASVLPTSPALW